ncbi:hypothetical protein ACFX11_025862 [Malus domestica]
MDRYVVMSRVDLGRSLGSGNTAPFDPGLLGAVESMTGLLRLLPDLQTAKNAPKTKEGIQLPSIVGSGEWGKPPFKKCGSSTEVLLEQTPSIAVQKQTFPRQQQQLQQQSPQIQVCTSLAQNSTFEQAHALTLVGEGIVNDLREAPPTTSVFPEVALSGEQCLVIRPIHDSELLPSTRVVFMMPSMLKPWRTLGRRLSSRVKWVRSRSSR